MPLLKRTYSLPEEIVEQFEQTVRPGQRSMVLASLVRAWVEEKRREQLRREVVAGCQDMAEVYLEVEREYHPLEEEVEHAFNA